MKVQNLLINLKKYIRKEDKMLEDKLRDYLKTLDKEELELIIFNHYKFIVDKLERLKKENKGFKEKDMNILVNKTNDEIEFIKIQLGWFENYIFNKIKE
jgi:hypothetical protein